MEARIREEMFNLGILSNKRGYIYIIEAVKRFGNFTSMENIYNSIARQTIGHQYLLKGQLEQQLNS